jgi:enhancer of mRNA-decapping protein 3
MASEFIGYTILVTLKTPPNTQIQGTVASVLGQRLTLQDGSLNAPNIVLQSYSPNLY